MAIGWSTAAILVVLLPGFAFIAGLLSTERIGRDTTPRSAIAHLAGIVFVSFFLHAVFLGLLKSTSSFGLWPAPNLALIFSALLGGLNGPGDVRELVQNVTANLGWITSYEGLLCIFAFGSGRRLGSFALGNPAGRFGSGRIVRWLSFLVEHRWAYDLLPDREGGFAPTYVHLLTKTGTGGTWLLYSGRVARCGLRPDGRFAYFILQAAERRFLRIVDEGAADLGPRSPVLSASVKATGKPGDHTHEFLYVDAEDVANVFIHRYRINTTDALANARAAVEKAKQGDQRRGSSPT